MILRADARHIPLADETVQCVVTSPPYWGLRSYVGVPDSVWGGDPGCRHVWGAERLAERRPYSAEFAEAINSTGMGPAKFNGAIISQGAFCHCGAWRGQLGLEPKPEMFVAHLVEVFREVWRVLRKDGVCFVNIGDSFWSNGGAGGTMASGGLRGVGDVAELSRPEAENPALFGRWLRSTEWGLEPKDLCLIPFRLAIALQEDGWFVRQDIVWAKLATMPESVVDRCTRSHEYIFHLTKSARYYWDAQAIAEPLADSSYLRLNQPTFESQQGGFKDYGEGSNRSARRTLRNLKNAITPRGDGERWNENNGRGFVVGATRNKRDVWFLSTEPNRWALCRKCRFVSEQWPECRMCGGEDAACARCAGRRICPQCGSGDVTGHFAAYPSDLPKECILAATSEYGACAKCGASWERINEVRYVKSPAHAENSRMAGRSFVSGANGYDGYDALRLRKETQSIGWRSNCECEGAGVAPCVVLDPFLGSGTTLAVAERLGRRGVGLEMSPDYISIAQKRTAQRSLFSWRRSESTEEREDGERG